MQVHGAIGYTWEADLQLWMKKAWALQRAWATPPSTAAASPRRSRRGSPVTRRGSRVRDDPGAGAGQRRALPRPRRDRRRRRCASRSPSSRRGSRRRRARSWPPGSSRATGSASGRRTSPSGCSPRSARSVPVACSSRSTPGSRVRRPRTCSVAAARASSAPSPASSTPTTSRCCATPVVPDTLEHIVVLHGDAPDGTTSFADFLAAPARSPPTTHAPRADAVGPDDVADIIFTSGTTGKPKGAMTTHAQTLRTFDAWANTVGPGARRPLPGREPVLPHLRLQGRDHRLLHPGRHDRARAGVRRPRGARARRRRAHHDVAGPAHALPLDPRPSRTATRSTSRRCGSRSPARPRCRSR